MPLSREVALEFATKAKARGLSNEEIQLHLTNLGGVEPSRESTEAARGAIMGAIDYPGSVGRAGLVAPLLEKATGKDLGVSFKEAIKGKSTPSTSELMKKADVGELGKLSDVLPIYGEPGNAGMLQPEKGGPLDITGRGAVGFAGDIASDPLTYMGAGLMKGAKKLGAGSKTAQVMEMMAEPISSTIKGTGKKIYSWGISPAEQEAKKYGKQALTPTLIEEGIYKAPWKGTVSEQMDTLGEKLLKEAQDRATQSKKAGGVASMKDAVKPMLEKAAQLRSMRDPKLVQEAVALEKRASELMDLDPKYAYTPVEKLPSKTTTLDLPLQGAEFTPVQKRAPKIETVDLSRPGSEFTPISKIPEKIETLDLPTQGYELTPIEKRNAKLIESLLPFKSQTKSGLGEGILLNEPTLIREPPGMQRSGPNILTAESSGPMQIRTPERFERSGPNEFIKGETAPTHIRTPGGYEKASPTTLTSESTGPIQFIEPGGFIKARPSTYDTPGLNAEQVRFLKTRANEAVNKKAWNPMHISDLDEQVAKLEGQGLRGEELATIERSLGPEARKAQEEGNRKLGSILTTNEKQMAHEARMDNKLKLGQMKAGLGAIEPKSAIAMMVAQALEQGMTPLGYGVYKTGQKVPESVYRQGLLRATED